VRCKVGDLAWVVADIECPQNNGRGMVRIDARAAPDLEPFEWECSALTRLVSQAWDSGEPYVAVPGDLVLYRDRELKPLRDPGDDAVDETLQPREVMA